MELQQISPVTRHGDLFMAKTDRQKPSDGHFILCKMSAVGLKIETLLSFKELECHSLSHSKNFYRLLLSPGVRYIYSNILLTTWQLDY